MSGFESLERQIAELTVQLARATAVGQCGNASPGNKLPRINCGNHYYCSLPAGHAGWHQEDQARWGKHWSDEPDDALAGVLAELRHAADLNYGEPARVGLLRAIEIVSELARGDVR